MGEGLAQSRQFNGQSQRCGSDFLETSMKSLQGVLTGSERDHSVVLPSSYLTSEHPPLGIFSMPSSGQDTENAMANKVPSLHSETPEPHGKQKHTQAHSNDFY